MKASAISTRVLDGEQHGATPLAAHTKSLDESQRHEQYGRPDADLRVGWRQANQRRRDAHDQQRPDEHLLSANAIAEMTEDDTA